MNVWRIQISMIIVARFWWNCMGDLGYLGYYLFFTFGTNAIKLYLVTGNLKPLFLVLGNFKIVLGVNVNNLNRCLSYAVGYGDIGLARENYDYLPDSSKVDVCDECDECVVRCANGLDLTETIRRARELFV